MANRITCLCIDARDPGALAAFWAEVLGWQITDRDDDLVRVQDGPAASLFLDFLQVPDPAKLVKNRLHLDVRATDRDQASELERLLALGARPVDIGQGEVSWQVLADPEGNEFCLLADPSAEPRAN